MVTADNGDGTYRVQVLGAHDIDGTDVVFDAVRPVNPRLTFQAGDSVTVATSSLRERSAILNFGGTKPVAKRKEVEVGIPPRGWPEYRGGPAKNAGNPGSKAPANLTLDASWQTPAGVSGQIVASTTSLFFSLKEGAGARQLVEFDIASQAVLWANAAVSGASLVLAVGAAHLYAADGFTFYKIDRSDGSTVWSRFHYPTIQGILTIALDEENGRLYLQSDPVPWDNKVWALDTADGDILWEYSSGDNAGWIFTGGSSAASIAYDGAGRLFLREGYRPGEFWEILRVRILNADTGAILTTTDLFRPPDTGEAIKEGSIGEYPAMLGGVMVNGVETHYNHPPSPTTTRIVTDLIGVGSAGQVVFRDPTTRLLSCAGTTTGLAYMATAGTGYYHTINAAGAGGEVTTAVPDSATFGDNHLVFGRDAGIELYRRSTDNHIMARRWTGPAAGGFVDTGIIEAGGAGVGAIDSVTHEPIIVGDRLYFLKDPAVPNAGVVRRIG